MKQNGGDGGDSAPAATPASAVQTILRATLPLGLVAVAVLGVVLASQQSTLTRSIRNLNSRIGLLEDRLVDISRGISGTAAGASPAATSVSGGSSATATGLANLPLSPLSLVQLVDDDPSLGAADAPVTIIEFSDFECPFCKRFFLQTLPQITARYIDTGQVRFVFRDFPVPQSHPNATKAAEAAACAGEDGRFWPMHDELFGKGVAGGSATYSGYAQALGLDTAAFGACLDSGRHAAEIAGDRDAGIAAGVRATPGFVVVPPDGRAVVFAGAHPFSVFEQLIEAALRS
jgi:protein-disulfide isomerase